MNGQRTEAATRVCNDYSQTSSDTQQTFMDMLTSMGVSEYDPSVLVALEEYGRRISTDLLCDAKDFATHASRKDIDTEDVKMAIKLKDSKNIVPSTHIQAQQDTLINSQKLPLFPEDNITLNSNNLPILQTRPYTYVPGHVAYVPPSDEAASTAVSKNGHTSSNGNGNSSGSGHKKQQIPIILHPEKRGENNGVDNKKQRVLLS